MRTHVAHKINRVAALGWPVVILMKEEATTSINIDRRSKTHLHKAYIYVQALHRRPMHYKYVSMAPLMFSCTFMSSTSIFAASE